MFHEPLTPCVAKRRSCTVRPPSAVLEQDSPMTSARRFHVTPLALALAVLLPVIAHAADPIPASAADAPVTPADAAGNATQLDAINVVSQGSTRQVQRISRQDIEQLTPGSSAFKAVEKLPGVQFQSADPFGTYEWSTQVTLHGFDQSRLGYTLDGIPLGNMSYGVTNGLHIIRAIISENIGSVEIAQGAGALGTASNTNLGGTMQFYSADPQTTPGARLVQTVGSDATRRTFARADTGDRNGLSAYLSYANASTDKWKGFGDQQSEQANLKTVYQWGDGNRLSLFLDTSRRKEYDYMDLSLTSQRALFWDYDYLQPDWATAVQMARAYQTTGATSGVANGYPQSLAGLPDDYSWLDASYYAGGGLRRDNLAGLSGTFVFGGATLDAAGYYHANRGEGQWVTPYVVTSAQIPVSMRTTDYGLDRFGGTSALKWSWGNHDLEAGVWAENARTTQGRNYFALGNEGYTSLYNVYEAQTPFRRDFQQRYTTQTRMLYLQDTVRLLDDRLTVNYGAKALSTTTRAQSLVPTTALAQGRIRAEDNFLPQVGVNYKLDERQDIYASYSKNIAAFGFTPFATSQAAFDRSRSTLEPEESQTVQVGYRVQDAQFQLSADAYFTKFSNRLLTTSPCTAVQTCASILSNVGAVHSAGADLALMWRPIEGLSWLNSLSWNRSRYQDDYLNNGVVATAGKDVVGIPALMFSSSASYQIGNLRLDLDGKYVDKRYITFLNDSQVPSYWLFNAGARYDFGRLGGVADVALALNITNLTDKRYFASTGTNGYVASDPNGYNQTMVVGAPRQTFLSLDVKF
ncbi:TonB-dependent receptor [Xanthomonas campestris pv. campestris]|uniref:TonB-dependent receptor n=1 Tax=Xanthomonas campestris TaxID=339 RepID=UPI00237845C1|nr:TonB-dependent receptor [Xanthomonas campestris]MDM7585440.1 TonB-dependent receptor [Xanthomonas campestris]MDM7592522.1 TonB-dependent receptor [Xanthomonas campestris]MEA9866235.1 TonB-dependent receptor [Xanthomonas campestris pv. raphani]WDK57296.1 TonB-dependent receptor [Xanthomonas campestris pv. campestris]WDK63795.1 TonB-dependent receptor [Xanthomonas campestris pv. campestris]